MESLLGAYALDATSDEEAAAVEAHLEECPRCRAEVDALREVAGAMGNAAEPLPPALWDRIASQLELDEVRPASPFPLGALPTDDTAGAGGSRSPSTVVPMRRPVQRAGRQRVVLAVLGVAAAVVIAFLAVNLANANSTVSQLQSATAPGISASAAAAQANPASRQVVLRTPTGATLADMVMLDGHGYMLGATMPTLPAGQTYQLWGFYGGRPISLGLLGNHPTVAAFSTGATAPASLAVTVEPAGGVSAPTAAPVGTAVVAA
jgi:anti-sigma-K factor RskA